MAGDVPGLGVEAKSVALDAQRLDRSAVSRTVHGAKRCVEVDLGAGALLSSRAASSPSVRGRRQADRLIKGVASSGAERET